MGTIVVTPSDRMERHLAVGGVSRSLRSNVRLEWILYRVRDERIHGDRDDCLQPKTRLQTVAGGGKQEP